MNLKKISYVKNKNSILLILYVIFFSILSIYIIYKGTGFVKSVEKVYINNSSIDYSVYLKENDYFESEYLDKGKKYIASLIDNINIDFNYVLDSNNEFNGNYKYNIDVNLVVTEHSKDTILWSKNYEVTEYQQVDFNNQKKVSVSDSLVIDYDYYNDIVSSFKKDYALPIDAYLIVKLNVKTKIINNVDNFYLIEDEPQLKIPLSKQTIDIIIEEDKDKEVINRYTYVDKPFFHYSLVAIGIIFLMIYFIIGINILIKILKKTKKLTKYERYLKKIFSDYDQIIINVSSFPKKNNNELVLTRFEELIDAQMEIRKPIVFYDDRVNKRAIFVLNDETHAFKFIVKESDFDR